MERLIYPVSTANFKKIRENGNVYVDKTRYVYELVSKPGYYFLSRPRRFGKSLLLSTIESFYNAERHLFEGLAIDSLMPQAWERHPVIHLDMSTGVFKEKDSLALYLSAQVMQWERSLGIDEPLPDLSVRFQRVIRTAYEKSGRKVVVLVDEYDSPLSSVIDRKELFDVYREELHGFYSVLKAADRYMEFCMLTGVTRFGKVSVFSGLNNLQDISIVDRFAGICGITKAELLEYFKQGVEELAEANRWSPEEALEKLRYNYDGYHFSGALLDVYNPFSVLNALSNSDIRDYWCESGVPTLLAKTLYDLDYDFEEMNGCRAYLGELGNLSSYKMNPVPLFYQCGYLSIRAYEKEDDEAIYTLGFPNREVERGIMRNILEYYTEDTNDTKMVVADLRQSLRKGEPERFVKIMKAYLSGIPGKIRTRIDKFENYYHTVFYCISSLIGLNLDVEFGTARGFIDMQVKTPDYIYIMEFKVNGTASDAICQIEEKGYADQYANDSRRLFKVGIGFSKKTHTVESYVIK